VAAAADDDDDDSNDVACGDGQPRDAVRSALLCSWRACMY